MITEKRKMIPNHLPGVKEKKERRQTEKRCTHQKSLRPPGQKERE